MNIGTLIVLLALIFVVCLIFASMYKDKKNGKSVICVGDCGSCGGHCHHMEHAKEQPKVEEAAGESGGKTV